MTGVLIQRGHLEIDRLTHTQAKATLEVKREAGNRSSPSTFRGSVALPTHLDLGLPASHFRERIYFCCLSPKGAVFYYRGPSRVIHLAYGLSWIMFHVTEGKY